MNLTDLIGPVVNTNPESHPVRKVLLCGQDDLLSQAVGSFLKDTHWEVIRVSDTGDMENLIRETKRAKPEVVILCWYKADDSTLALRLIEEKCCLKVITLGMDSNQIQVYSKQNIFLRGAADLLSIIEEGNLSDCTSEKEVGSTQSNP